MSLLCGSSNSPLHQLKTDNHNIDSSLPCSSSACKLLFLLSLHTPSILLFNFPFSSSHPSFPVQVHCGFSPLIPVPLQTLHSVQALIQLRCADQRSACSVPVSLFPLESLLFAVTNWKSSSWDKQETLSTLIFAPLASLLFLNNLT